MGMSKQNIYAISALIIAAALIAGFFIYRGLPGQTMAGKTYESTTYGISFTYPETYTLQERNITEGTPHYSVTLVDTDDLTGVPEGGEGPTAMSFDIYPAGGKDTETWIEQSQASNFNLSVDKVMHDATVGGMPAVAYTWDGLYRGNSFVFAHKGNIIMASATYMTTDDQILKDFTNVLKSVSLK